MDSIVSSLIFTSFCLLLAFFATANFAVAANSLDDMLGLSHNASGAVGAGDDKRSLVMKTPVAEWRLVAGQKSCGPDGAVVFRGQAGTVALVGPTAHASGAIMFMSPNIKLSERAQENKVSMMSNNDPANYVSRPRDAVLMETKIGVSAVPADMSATLKPTKDIEQVRLVADGATLLNLSLAGVFAARDALARCMGMAPTTGNMRSPTALKWLVSSAALATWPAHALVWGLFHSEGERPTRSHYVADFYHIPNRTDPQEMLAVIGKVQAEAKNKRMTNEEQGARIEWLTSRPELNVTQIQESADGPYARAMTLVFSCAENMVTITRNRQYYRENGRIDEGPIGGPRPANAPWLENAKRIACEQKPWRDAWAHDMKRTQKSDPSELNRLGIGFLGRFSNPVDIDKLLWAATWQDGTRPAFTDKRSAQEIESILRSNQEQNAMASKMADGMIGALEATMKSEDSESAFMQVVSATFAKKSQTHWRIMSPQVGWTEKEVLAFWGAPSQTMALSDGARMFVYRKQSDERVTTQTVDMRSGNVVASSTDGKLRECELGLTLKAGGRKPGPRLVDFTMSGENCNIDTLGKGRPK